MIRLASTRSRSDQEIVDIVYARMDLNIIVRLASLSSVRLIPPAWTVDPLYQLFLPWHGQ